MATIYCIDTSSLIAAWQERYPPEHFPAFWGKMNVLIDQGQLVAIREVLEEMTKRSDELHKWLKQRGEMFRDLEAPIQLEAARILGRFPRLVGERKLRTSADPFVIALAKVEGMTVVTEEKPTGSLQSNPKIPDVCGAIGVPWIGLLDLIKAEKWVIG